MSHSEILLDIEHEVLYKGYYRGALRAPLKALGSGFQTSGLPLRSQSCRENV